MLLDVPSSQVAAKYNTIHSTMWRHKKKHLAAELLKADTDKKTMHASSLLEKIKALEVDARRIGATAEESGDAKTALQAVREIARICELLGKLTGELQTGNNTINVQVNMGPLPEVGELAARFTQLDTPEAAARRKWISEGGPLPKHLLPQAIFGSDVVEDVVEGEIIKAE
jgi:hypothetical protein